MRKVNFLVHLEVAALPDGDRGCCPLADAVHSQHHGLLERGWEKRGCGVALMMLGKQQLVLPIEIRIKLLEAFTQQVLLEQLFFQPYRNCHFERAKADRGE